jgi:hypothetical protein
VADDTQSRNWLEQFWAFLTGAGSGGDGGHVGAGPATARPDGYRSVEPMTGTAHDPNDVVLVGPTDFNGWDPQKIWHAALADLGKWSAAATAAGGQWKDLHAAITGHRADGDPKPPPSANLSDDLKKMVGLLVGDATGWAGAAPVKFQEAIAQVVTFAADLDGRASAPPGTTSMATVSDVLASHMTAVFERLRGSQFTNGGASWSDTSKKEPGRFYALDPPGSGWGRWAAQQTLKVQVHMAHTTINGRQWEHWAAAGEAELHAPGQQAKVFGQQMTEAKVNWLTASQKALFAAAGNHLKDLYTTMHRYVPIVPPSAAPTRPGDSGPVVTTSGPAPGPMPSMPAFDAGAGLPSPEAVLGPGLTPGAGDGAPFAAVGDGLPGAVVGSDADIATTPAEFAPPAFGMTDGLGALTPSSVAGAFGPGLPGPDGSMVAGGMGAPRIGGLPVGLVGTAAGGGVGKSGAVAGEAGVGAVRGADAGPRGATGAGARGVLMGGPGAAGAPIMPPMMPPGRSGQEAEESDNNLVEDRLFEVEPEGTEAVVGHREAQPSGRPEPTPLTHTRRARV